MKTFHINNYNWRLLFQRLWLPEKVNGLPKPVNGLPESVNGLPEPVNGLPESVHGLPESVNGKLTKAIRYNERVHDPTGWWMSEMSSEVRGFWDGRQLHSRNGDVINAPPWFIKDLPKDMHLDGELFNTYGSTYLLTKLQQSQEHYLWRSTKYHVFDCPHLCEQPFEERMKILEKYFEKSPPQYATLVQQTICKSKEHLQEELNKVVDNGGRGIYLRQPKSCYETGISTTLLEVKKLHSVEAVVIGYIKRTNQTITSLRCRLASGRELSVNIGLSLQDCNNPPKIGSVIKLTSYKRTKSGEIYTPCFKGVCEGKTEEQLQEEWNQIVNPQGEGIKSTGKTKHLKLYSAEAVVIGHKEGTKYPCSSLRCRMANGIEFSCRVLTVKDCNNPPKIGSVIKFTYSALAKHHKPTVANFKGVNEDKTVASADIIEAIHES